MMGGYGTVRQLAAVTVGVALGISGGTASADPGEVTHVDEISAIVDGDLVTVTGQATFVDAPLLVGEDSVGDATISGVAGGAIPLADDLTSATIARPDPFQNTLTFTMGVANQPPEVNGIPEGIISYRWEIIVDGQQFVLHAVRTGQGPAPGGIDPLFEVRQNSQNLAVVDGAMAGGVVEWEVPMSRINATAGSVIEQGLIVSTLGVGGLVTLINLGGDQVLPDEDLYVVPGPTVRVGIAPIGTPPAQVPLTMTGTVEATGAFSVTLPSVSEPGEYTVVARACDGPDSCGVATTDITVTTP